MVGFSLKSIVLKKASLKFLNLNFKFKVCFNLNLTSKIKLKFKVSLRKIFLNLRFSG